MNVTTLKRLNWFWPWQDEKEEAWLEEMSQVGWHLKSMQLPCVYYFNKGEPGRFTYRLDYMPADKAKNQEYLQIFLDAGWEYIGEMSNWRYWRKLSLTGEPHEIFTDVESKLRKYRRLLAYMAFFLALLVFIGINVFRTPARFDPDYRPVLSAIYLLPKICYAVVIPIYMVVVVQLLRRINRLKKKIL
jgi:Protein of unknown function (DUF2812)